MTKKFEFLEHTGDVKIRAYGHNLSERFNHVALAVASIMHDPNKVEPKHTKTITTTGKDKKALLYNFIEEFLFLLDTEFFLLHKITSCKIEEHNKEFKLTATITGDINQGQYLIEGGVKASTYNEMEITDEYIQMVVDI